MSKYKVVQIEIRFKYMESILHSNSKMVLNLNIGPEMSELCSFKNHSIAMTFATQWWWHHIVLIKRASDWLTYNSTILGKCKVLYICVKYMLALKSVMA